MAKWLSDLQKSIMNYAYKKGTRSFEGYIGGFAEGKFSGYIIWQIEALDEFYGNRKRDNKTRVTINKAFGRLEDRGIAAHILKGLLNDYRSGLILTGKGIDQTEKLMANTGAFNH